MCNGHGKTYKYWLRRDCNLLVDAIMIGQTIYEHIRPQPGSAHEDAARARVIQLNTKEAGNG